MKGLLVSGGEKTEKSLIKKYMKDRITVCADGGIKNFTNTDLKPDLVVGDFDSVNEKDIKFIKDNNIEIKKYMPVKDSTDTEIAIEILKSRNCDDIIILSATGSRFDHTIANIFLLEKLFKSGIKAQIINSNNIVIYAESGVYKIFKDEFKYISVISLSEETVYSSKGLFYETDKLKIKRSSSRGVSNEILNENAEIIIHSGKCLIIKSRD